MAFIAGLGISVHSVVMAVTGIVFLLAVRALAKTIESHDDLEWKHLIATQGRDGKFYADWNKIGQGLGVILCFWMPAIYAYSDKMTAEGMAMVLTVVLLYLGGVSGYANNLRSKQGNTQTTTVTEVAPAAKVTETVIEPERK